MHVHVHGSDGEAKFWLEPEIELEHNFGLTPAQLKQIEKIIEAHYHDLQSAWKTHFRS